MKKIDVTISNSAESDLSDSGREDKKQVTEASSKEGSDTISEVGGVDGPEPTRYGDWTVNGRCTDF